MNSIVILIAAINQCLVKKSTFLIYCNSKVVVNFLDSLWNYNLIVGYTINKNKIYIYFKYDFLGTSIIKKLKLISTPGNKVHCKLNSFNKHTKIITSNNGICLNYNKNTEVINGGKVIVSIII